MGVKVTCLMTLYIYATLWNVMCREGLVNDAEGNNSPVGFKEKEKPKDLSKKAKDQQARKDIVSTAKLATRKIKEILGYPCCDNCCLRKLGLTEVTKQRE